MSQAIHFAKSGLARLEAEVLYSEHVCSSKMLLLLSQWTLAEEQKQAL